MIIGMDFGTTNSGMAVYDGRQVELLDLDPTNNNPKVARTALYLTNDQNVFIGREAIDRYFEHNLGRPARMEQIWVGEIEVTVSEMTWVQDVYIWVDALSPGRLFLSIKSSLRDADYLGTVIEPFFYSLEDLIALYLTATRSRAEQLLDQELKQVVLGRPVKFSNDPQQDELAQQRLIESALRAGYEEIYFQYEPVAAALHYEQSIEGEENVLIFDFGGGTLDITVMRLGGPKRRAVLATGGVPIAGDIFDQKTIRAKLPKHFGQDTVYRSGDKELTMPNWIHNTFSNWQTILQLQTPKNVQLLQNIARTAHDAGGINALVSLVSGNYGLRMFDAVERAKQRLSRRSATMLPFNGPGFDVRESITRAEFEAIISQDARLIEQSLTETLKQSGLRAEQIDAVIRTGGSSQIPLFEQLLEQKFGPDKVRSSNIFSSVTSGLGITAYGIENGEIEAPVYRKSERPVVNMSMPRPNVSPIDLGLLQRQIALTGAGQTAGPAEPASKLVVLPAEGEPLLLSLPPSLSAADSLEPITLAEPAIVAAGPMQRVLAINPEAVLLWTTSDYRFFLLTGQRLETMQDGGLTLAGVQQLAAGEEITNVEDWQAIKQAPLMVLITSQGVARQFRMQTMQGRIESPAPFKLDRTLLGRPVSLLGTTAESEIILLTKRGRATRVRVRDISVQSSQLISRSNTDRVIGAVAVKPDDQLLLLNGGGHARRLPVDQLPLSAGKAKTVSLTGRRDVYGLAVIRPDSGLVAVTTTRFQPLDLAAIPLEEAASKKIYPALKLAKGEAVCGLITLPISNRS